VVAEVSEELEASCVVPTCEAPAVDHPVCANHHARLATALRHGVARQYVELNQALRPGTTGNDEPRVSVSKEKPLPISVDARSMQEEILATALATELILRVHRGWVAPPPRGREGPTLVACCAVLADHLDELLRIPAALNGCLRLLDVLHAARQATGDQGPRHNRLDLRCPSCQMRSLRRRNGTDLISCAYCQAEMTAQQHDDLLDPPTIREAA
jgi:hypothetical protein